MWRYRKKKRMERKEKKGGKKKGGNEYCSITTLSRPGCSMTSCLGTKPKSVDLDSISYLEVPNCVVWKPIWNDKIFIPPKTVIIMFNSKTKCNKLKTKILYYSYSLCAYLEANGNL
jgi:hypothetical protein